jgi:nucleotide-binding universal stress UspA family protein
MKRNFSATSDQYGHIITGVGGSVQTRALFVLPKPEQVGLFPEAGQSDAESLQNRGIDHPSLRDRKKQSPILSIERIIVAVSLTKDSEATARYAAEIAKHFNASLYLAYAFWPPPVYEFESEGACNLIARREKQLRAKLDELAERMQGLVPECDSVFLMGEPAERISALARDVHADLIVTASHHPGFLARLFTLDEAPKIMHRAPCPVLVYHDKNT